MENKKLMKAVIHEDGCSADKLKVDFTEKPSPSTDQILVKVHASALNRADILQRLGKYPPPAGASPILGLEISGTVESTGSSAVRWKKGDKVFGLLPGGGYAEYAVIHEDMAMKIPSALNFNEAASIPEVFLTAYQALVWHSHLKEGEKILIHAGASGVGTAAIQIAKTLDAAVYVTASKSKHDICINLGAEKAIDYKTENFAKKIKEFNSGKGVDVIIDFIAGPYYKMNIDSLNIDGRMVLLATLGGGLVDEIDLRNILSKRLTITGSALRSRTREYQIKLTKEFAGFALEKFESGILKPVVDKVFDMSEVSLAHKYMEENKNTGKIVLKISG